MPKPKNRKLRSAEDDRALDKERTLEALKDIARNNPNAMYLADLYHNLPMDRKTFDKLYPVGSQARNEMLELLDMNVERMKLNIRDRLLNLNQSIGLIALYKLIGTEDERDALKSGKSERKQEEDTGKNNITLTIG